MYVFLSICTYLYYILVNDRMRTKTTFNLFDFVSTYRRTQKKNSLNMHFLINKFTYGCEFKIKFLQFSLLGTEITIIKNFMYS